MSSPSQAQSTGPAPLDRTLKKNQAIAAEVQSASEDLAVVATVLEQELPDHVQVGDVAQAIEHANQLEKQLAQSAQELTKVNEALAKEVEKRAG
ncbi:hypothetical protein [Variovorax sp. UMC13]|uniref:hypothetical protein n=1 Tax=Variovorax sp. UMC13 TaxID=1862326 RepID=UPI00160155D7|nr:hypothetical protein [Variovorax sp. UMC13]MBB1602416.1 hypothetical protein [Variovorax sp. UMC13]